MAKAPHIIDQALERATTTLPQAWIETEAMRLAKLRVKDQLRANNLRTKDYEYAEITRLAQLWLQGHRAELLGFATLELLFAAERNRKRAKLVSDAPKIEA